MSHQGSFRSVFVVFAAVCLWLFPLMFLFDHLHLSQRQSAALLADILSVGRLAMLLLGLMPVFLVCWVAGEPVEDIGRNVCQSVWRIFAWTGGLYELLGGRNASWLE